MNLAIVAVLLVARALSPQPPSDAFAKAPAETRRACTERAPDFVALDSGAVIDLYRLRRIRELCDGKPSWSKVSARDLLKLGAGHADYNADDDLHRQRFGVSAGFPDRCTFREMPALASIVSPAKSDAILFIASPHVTDSTRRDTFLQVRVPVRDPGPRTIVYNPEDVSIDQVLQGGAFLRYQGQADNTDPPYGIPREHFYARGDFAGRSDGQHLFEDFAITPAGTYRYRDAIGGMHTVQSYTFEHLKPNVSPEELYELAADGTISLCRYSVTSSGPVTSWSARRVKIAPAP